MKTLKELKDINFEKLNNEVSKLTGYHIELGRTIAKNKKFIIGSDELKQHTGIMQNFYESFKIDGWGELSADNSYVHIYCNISFSYKNGSSNGLPLCNCWYIFANKKWVVKT